ncbi:BTB/POZ domain-containing protein At2g04740 [Macadamia integrifolia]|uniref:BTB/POZ domain-containing protein At2g04740 n=1 Tax=Macadamia integrifolia TaxID=60698 RepID=UPI001C5020DC|nr:BTB/POZ domain-containing protein At2g04740 [Macadamia integrifolia]
MSERQSWSIDSELEGIDLDPEDFKASVPLKKVPTGDVFEASRAGDVERLRFLLESGVNVNARDQWDSAALYYACLAGHLDAARMLLESGAICSEHTFDGDRCHYAALNLKVRKLLKAFEARPPPLGPLQAALRETFLGCRANRAYFEQSDSLSNFHGTSSNDTSTLCQFPPDVVFFVQGRPIEAHRVILSARSGFYMKKFESDWRDRREVRFSSGKLSYPALYSLFHFFYSDRLEVAVDDMEDLIRICKVCKCEGLQKVLEKELIHQKYADYKSLRDEDNSQKRFILQGLSLPEEDQLPAALYRILQRSLAKSSREQNLENATEELMSGVGSLLISDCGDDLADVCIRVDGKIFRCHQVILAARSEYFKARLSRMTEFLEGTNRLPGYTLPCIEEHDLSAEAFEKMIEYMYTDGLKDIDPNQAEEMFDAASRYLLFPLKRAVADALLPHLEMVSPAELCQWLMLSDMYAVLKIREYCLDIISCNFETFADTREFRAMLLELPPPSGDSSLRTTLPSAPGAGVNTDQGNILDDLRDKWLEAEAAELDKRDESAALFDKRLEMLILVAQQENTENETDDP